MIADGVVQYQEKRGSAEDENGVDGIDLWGGSVQLAAAVDNDDLQETVDFF